MASPGGKHWVEDLFPPRFGLILDDILKDELPKDDTVDITGDMATRTTEDSVFAKLARKVSPLDVASIKNVYERVWVMMHLEEEERRKAASQRDKVSIPVSENNTTRSGQRDVSTSTSDIDEKAPVDIHDPCLWNSNEIEILRSVFQTAKDQNLKLRAQIFETQNQFEKLQEKYKKQNKEHETRTRRLGEATKANERLTIVVNNLKQQVDSAVRQIDGLKRQVREMDSSRNVHLKEIHKLRVAADHERLDHRKVKLELQNHTQEALREKRIHEENLKLIHDGDIQFLQKMIEELSQELEREKKDHDRTKRGLNHLRQHFSSLSICHVKSTEAEGIVSEDQLKQWTY